MPRWRYHPASHGPPPSPPHHTEAARTPSPRWSVRRLRRVVRPRPGAAARSRPARLARAAPLQPAAAPSRALAQAPDPHLGPHSPPPWPKCRLRHGQKTSRRRVGKGGPGHSFGRLTPSRLAPSTCPASLAPATSLWCQLVGRPPLPAAHSCRTRRFLRALRAHSQFRVVLQRGTKSVHCPASRGGRGGRGGHTPAPNASNAAPMPSAAHKTRTQTTTVPRQIQRQSMMRRRLMRRNPNRQHTSRQSRRRLHWSAKLGYRGRPRARRPVLLPVAPPWDGY